MGEEGRLTRYVGLIALTLVGVTPHAGTAQPATNVSGVWAHRVVTTSVSKLPVIGKITNESRFFARVEMRQTGEQLQLTIEPCWVRMVGDMARVKTIVPDAAVAVMGPRSRTGAIVGREITIDRAVDVIGARLANEWSDPLPEKPGDAAEWDEDGDGKPGVTIRIMGPIDGEVYVAQRSWNKLEGIVDDDGGTIRGLVTWTTEQSVVDSSSIFLNANPASKPHADKKRSHFQMRRMPAETTCADIKRRNESLFKVP